MFAKDGCIKQIYVNLLIYSKKYNYRRNRCLYSFSRHFLSFRQAVLKDKLLHYCVVHRVSEEGTLAA